LEYSFILFFVAELVFAFNLLSYIGTFTYETPEQRDAIDENVKKVLDVYFEFSTYFPHGHPHFVSIESKIGNLPYYHLIIISFHLIVFFIVFNYIVSGVFFSVVVTIIIPLLYVGLRANGITEKMYNGYMEKIYTPYLKQYYEQYIAKYMPETRSVGDDN
jgi:hypothetical protein